MRMPQYSSSRQINIPYLLKIGYGKMERIGKYLTDKGLSDIALFWGEGLEELIGGKLYKGFEQHEIEIGFQQDVKYINIEEVDRVAFNLPRNTDAVVAVGGGKALDFGKYCAHLLKLPFISVPTSPSNDGFCSPNTSLLVDGKRKSVKSSIPFGVVVDLDVMRRSPKICFYSGLGDMISKVTALWDWKRAFLKGYERYNDFASIIAYNSLDILFSRKMSHIESPEFQRNLVTSLLMSGISMEIAGTSRPASGSEHLISHALDDISKRPRMHGLQVGVATYLCAMLQNNQNVDGIREVLTKTGFFDYVKEDPLSKDEFVRALQIAPTVKKDYYTVLSEKDSYNRALDFIEKDEILKQLVKQL